MAAWIEQIGQGSGHSSGAGVRRWKGGLVNWVHGYGEGCGDFAGEVVSTTLARAVGDEVGIGQSGIGDGCGGVLAVLIGCGLFASEGLAGCSVGDGEVILGMINGEAVRGLWNGHGFVFVVLLCFAAAKRYGSLMAAWCLRRQQEIDGLGMAVLKWYGEGTGWALAGFGGDMDEDITINHCSRAFINGEARQPWVCREGWALDFGVDGLRTMVIRGKSRERLHGMVLWAMRCGADLIACGFWLRFRKHGLMGVCSGCFRV
ncbi:hypothetical protein M0R45_036139 [Rubus argutus]|uniref:Uncharacterized protein n=1 Tax=Rubus argutus TaxID=59490 RepID=A0AAW1VV95_RUBAR